MIRSVVLVELKPGADSEALDAIAADLRALDCPGTVSYTIGDDLGLRDGNWGLAIVADFTNAEAYRNYDADEEHNRIRGRLAPLAQRTARVQFELPPGDSN